MSLISLTFGSENYLRNSHNVELVMPKDCIKLDPNTKNVVQVKKVCKFYGTTEPYIVCHVDSGAVLEGMQGNINGKPFAIKELDSKVIGVGKTGMVVGLQLEGITGKELEIGQRLLLS